MFQIQDGREHFYQWDIDTKLIVEDPTVTQVHFTNRATNDAYVCETYVEDDKTLVNVPNILLQTNWRIQVYAYDGKHTKHDKCYEVKSRSKPTDYVYTETEVKNWDALEERVEAAIDETGYYTPEVDADGNLSWTASKDTLPAITDVVNIKGTTGDTGATGAPGKDGKTAHPIKKIFDYTIPAAGDYTLPVEKDLDGKALSLEEVVIRIVIPTSFTLTGAWNICANKQDSGQSMCYLNPGSASSGTGKYFMFKAERLDTNVWWTTRYNKLSANEYGATLNSSYSTFKADYLNKIILALYQAPAGARIFVYGREVTA